MRILITGVAGHLGSRFARWVLERKPGVEVFGIDDLSCGYVENVPAGVRFVPARVGLAHMSQAIWREPLDYVFHFAAYAAECLSPFIRQYNYHNNLVETAALINQVLRGGTPPTCRRLVFTSSAAVYGSVRQPDSGDWPQPFDERDGCWPHDPYGVAKLACEQDLRIAGEQHGLDWCVLRPHNIYGPGQSLWQKYRNVFGLWFRAALEGQPLRIFGDGQQRRAFTYIDDILPCLWQAAVAGDASRQVINLGGSRPTTILRAAEIFRQVVSVSPQANLRFDGLAIEHVQPRHEVRDAWCTVEKSEWLLGYCDRTSLEDGLREMFAWAADAWDRYPARRDQPDPFTIELDQGLPPAWR